MLVEEHFQVNTLGILELAEFAQANWKGYLKECLSLII